VTSDITKPTYQELDDAAKVNYYFDKTLNHFEKISLLAKKQIDKMNRSITTGGRCKNTVKYLGNEYFVYHFAEDPMSDVPDIKRDWDKNLNTYDKRTTLAKCLLCKESFSIWVEDEGGDFFFNSFCRTCMGVKAYFNNFYSPDEYKEIFSCVIRERIRLYFDYRFESRRQAVLTLFANLSSEAEIIYQFKLMSIIPDYKIAGLDNILKLLDKAGVLEAFNQKKKMGGYRSVASNGMACLSMGERMIVEYLISQEIDFEKEPFYPKHDEFNPSGQMRADFKVKNLWIELAGMLGIPEYREKINRKKKLAGSLGLDLLILKDYKKKDLSLIKSRIKK